MPKAAPRRVVSARGPLDSDIRQARTLQKSTRNKGQRREEQRQRRADDQMQLTEDESERVMRVAREQMRVEEGATTSAATSATGASGSLGLGNDHDDDDGRRAAGGHRFERSRGLRSGVSDSDSDGDDDGGVGGSALAGLAGDDLAEAQQWDNEDVYEELELDADDERALALFMPQETAQESRTLADIIMERFRDIADQGGAGGDEREEVGRRLFKPEIYDAYRDVGTVLHRYTTGRIPKLFKMVPALARWEEVLYLTEPEGWSPQAMYYATRLFASNLNVKMAQRFFNLVLLPRVREDIRKYKRLHFHLYMALKKALFKPASFFKGVVIPLCEDGFTTLREAGIVASVVSKVSIPVLHSSATLIKLSQLEYTGATSLFMRVLINKKYNLPYRVIETLVEHFMRFMHEDRRLPVLWHQCLLVFVQRYKNDLTDQSKSALKMLCRKHEHPAITAEVRRELFGQQAVRQEELAAMDVAGGGGGK